MLKILDSLADLEVYEYLRFCELLEYLEQKQDCSY